jgi:predicted Rossmann-fold nucleotide-binding protein
MVLANISGFWDPLLELLRHMEDAGFLHRAHLARPLVVADPAQIVPSIMAAWEAEEPDAGATEIIENM